MTDELTLHVYGATPPSAALVADLERICDLAEDASGPGVLVLHVTSSPDDGWAHGLTIGLVTKWERTLRRLERLPVTTIAAASGDCGGTALDVFLTADVRVVAPGTRLLLPRTGDATWPGMAGYRLVQQAGLAGTRRAVLFGAPIPADEAVRLGLADRIGAGPDATTDLLGGADGREVAIRRQLMFEAATTSFEEALGSRLAACDRALRRAEAAA
jgi:isomerase DpgB